MAAAAATGLLLVIALMPETKGSGETAGATTTLSPTS
jgi:hypothetical protein